MKIKAEEHIEDFPTTEKIPRRKLRKLKEAKEDAREDLKPISEFRTEDLNDLKKSLEEAVPLRGDE